MSQANNIRCGSSTFADHIEWNDIIRSLEALEKKKKYKLVLLICLMSYTGMNISELLKLRWVDILDDSINVKYAKIKK